MILASPLVSRVIVGKTTSLTAFQTPADLDDPLPPPEPSGAAPNGGNEPSPEQISMIVDMGFTPQQGKKALLETVRSSFRSLLSISSTAH